MEKCNELHALGIPHVIPFKSGQCQAEVEDALYFDYTDGPSASGITVEEEGGALSIYLEHQKSIYT